MIIEETATTRTFACDYCREKGTPIKIFGPNKNTSGWVYIHILKQHLVCACPKKECQQKLDEQYPKEKWPEHI